MAMGIGCRRADSTVFHVEWSTIGFMGPATNRFFLTWGSGNPPSDRQVSESTTMGPIGEVIVPQSAVRQGAVFVRSLLLVDGYIIARFSGLITVPVPGRGNCGPLSSL